MKWTNVKRKLSELEPWARNPRQINESQAKRLQESFDEFGQVETIAIGPDNEIYNGHQRLNVLIEKHGGDYEVECRQSGKALSEKDREKLTVFLHKGAAGEWDWDVLANEFEIEDLTDWGFEEGELIGFDNDTGGKPAKETLAERFVVPPFSVLDARQGYWQKRKDAWISLGIRSELGRGVDLLNFSDACKEGYGEKNMTEVLKNPTLGAIPSNPAADLKHGTYASRAKHKQYVDGVLMKSDSGNDPTYYFKKQAKEKELGRKLTTAEFQEQYYEGPDTYLAGSSIFDPVLCELAYTWFMAPGEGKVIDPFAGGSVRGIVAAVLGKSYTGVELLENQVLANTVQAEEILGNDPKPFWIIGDSQDIEELAPGEYDLIFSCPPYGDLEVYSEDPRDISTMEFEDFIDVYCKIITKTVSLLKENSFACFVVGDYRDKNGFYRNFPALTIKAFQDVGMILYNEAVLVTALGSLPIRAGKQFQSGRKLGKTHQNILVFYKGDPADIKTWGDVEVGEVNQKEEELTF